MATAVPLTRCRWTIASEPWTQTHTVRGGVRLPSVSPTHKHMTRKELILDDIVSFIPFTIVLGLFVYVLVVAYL